MVQETALFEQSLKLTKQHDESLSMKALRLQKAFKAISCSTEKLHRPAIQRTLEGVSWDPGSLGVDPPQASTAVHQVSQGACHTRIFAMAAIQEAKGSVLLNMW